MSETTTDPSGVLRPYEAPERDPLPPVEPPAFTPAPPLSERVEPETTEPEPTIPDDAFAAWGPVEEPAPETELPTDHRAASPVGAEIDAEERSSAGPSIWSAFGSPAISEAPIAGVAPAGHEEPVVAGTTEPNDEVDAAAADLPAAAGPEDTDGAPDGLDREIDGVADGELGGAGSEPLDDAEVDAARDRADHPTDADPPEVEDGQDDVGTASATEAATDDTVDDLEEPEDAADEVDDVVDADEDVDEVDADEDVDEVEADQDAETFDAQPEGRDELSDEADDPAPGDEIAVMEAEVGESETDAEGGFWAPPTREPEVEPDREPAATITLPRQPFLIGLGVVAVALVALVALWRSAGDGSTAEVADVAPSATTGGEEAPVSDDGPPPSIDPTVADATAELDRELTEARAEAAALQAEIELLEARPAPGLPGERLRRVVVSADAKFVSATDNSVAVVGAFGGLSLIDPAEDRVVATAPIGDSATRVMRTSTAVWITDYADSRIVRVDPENGQVVASFPFSGPDGIVKDGDSLVVASFDDGIVARIDPSTGELLAEVQMGGSPTALLSHPDHGLWAAVFDTGEIVRIDQDDLGVVDRVVVGAGPVGISADATHLYVTNNDEGTVAQVDPASGEVVWTVEVGEGPTELVVVDGSAWVTVTDDGTLVELDVATGDVLTRTPLGGAVAGGGPTGISYGADALWIAMQGEQSVVKVEL